MKFCQGNTIALLLATFFVPAFLMYYFVEGIDLQIRHQVSTDTNKIFKNGMNMINSEIDCVDIIASIRKLKLITKVLLNENQQFLAEFGSQSVLNASENLLESNIFTSEAKLKRRRLPKPKSSCQTWSFESSKSIKVGTRTKWEHHKHIDLLINSLSESRLSSIDKTLIKFISSIPQKSDEVTVPKESFLE